MLAATFIVALGFHRQRITIVLSYVFVAAQATNWDDWWVLTLLMVAFAVVNEANKIARD